MASFFHDPATGDVRVHRLDSHAETEQALKLDLNIWREGHYLPDGELELRLAPEDHADKVEIETRFRNRFPRFVDFLNWALVETGQTETYNGRLDLSGLQSAVGLTLPKQVGWLDLSELQSAVGLTLPKKVGKLDLSKAIREELAKKNPATAAGETERKGTLI